MNATRLALGGSPRQRGRHRAAAVQNI